MGKMEVILELVKQKGPVLPSDLLQDTKENTTMIGAYLASLVASGDLSMTHAKIGGSPLYYTKEQLDGLQRLITHLNEKDQQTCKKLQEQKILYHEHLTPLEKASVEKLKDFAKKIQVNIQGSPHSFWKWHTISDQDAITLIKQLVTQKNATQVAQKPQQQSSSPQTPQPIHTQQEKENIQQQKEQKTSQTPSLQEQSKPTSVQQEVHTQPKVQEKISTQEAKNNEQQKQTPQTQTTLTQQQSHSYKEVTKQQHTETKQQRPTYIKGELVLNTKKYMEYHNIEIKELNVIKNNKELELTIIMHSPLGDLTYYCRIKDKKRCNDGDLSVAYVKGTKLHLPIMFLTTGEITKKTKQEIPNTYPGLSFLENFLAEQ